MRQKRKIMFGVRLIFIGMLSVILILFAAWRKESVASEDDDKKTLLAKEIDFTRMGIDCSKAERNLLSDISDAIMERKPEIIVKDVSEEERRGLWKTFLENSSISDLVSACTIKEDRFCVEYTYSEEEQGERLHELEEWCKRFLWVDSRLSQNASARRIALYHNVCTYFCDEMAEEATEVTHGLSPCIDSKRATDAELSKLLAFLFVQLDEQVTLIKTVPSSKQPFCGVYLWEENDGFFMFPGQEIRYTDGEGLLGFGLNNEAAKYYFGESDFQEMYSVNSPLQDYNSKSTTMLFARDVKAFQVVGELTLKMETRSESRWVWNIATGEKKVELENGFEKRTTSDGYRRHLYIPKEVEEDKDIKRPLLICLHGALESGNSLGKYGVPMKEKTVQEALQGAYVLVLESKLDYYKDEKRYNDIVEEVLEEHTQIDRSKIMLYGFSNGAAFACSMILERPELYQGMMISGCWFDWNEEQIKKIKEKHIWFMTGENDSYLIVDSSENSAKKMKEGGVDVLFHNFPKGGHSPIGMTDYVEELQLSALDWLVKLWNK